MEQLYKAIDRDDLPEGLTAQPPPSWKPGKQLTRPVEEVIEMVMGHDKGVGMDRTKMFLGFKEPMRKRHRWEARTEPQVRCASGARTLRWDAPRYVQEVEASMPRPRCSPWQAECFAS